MISCVADSGARERTQPTKPVNSSARELKLERFVVTELCRLVDTPRALTVYLLASNSEWDQLARLTIDHRLYEDPQHFADDYLVTELVRKSPNLPLDVDKVGAAVGSFWDSELKNFYSNERLLKGGQPAWIAEVARRVNDILGPLRESDLDKVVDAMHFGPGATTSVRGTGSVKSDKFGAVMHLTESLLPFMATIVGPRWAELIGVPEVVVGNRFSTVPKTALTDRGICVEPTLNVFGQLGVGDLLRRRLRRHGVDLNDQTRNQDLAQAAYVDGLATIDLSAASDSVCWALILLLLPHRWVHLLDLFRSPHTLIGNEIHELEKFSSMGNGYTFELESLIFWAVVTSVVPRWEWDLCSVYGDDIICPQKYATEVISRLKYLGFKTNASKSFLAGSFFESCGTDWFKGKNVRPFYLKGSSDNPNLPYIVQIANKLRLYAMRRGGGLYSDDRFRPLWETLYKGAPRGWRKTYVPLSEGDSGFIMSLEEAISKGSIPTRLVTRSRGRQLLNPWAEGHTGVAIRFPPQTRRRGNEGFLLASLLPYEFEVSRIKCFAPVLLRSVRGQERHVWHGLRELARLEQKAEPRRRTYGREPVRGLFGEPKTKRIFTMWDPVGLDWA